MIKVAQINMTNFGSTGKIMHQIVEYAQEYDVNCIVFTPYEMVLPQPLKTSRHFFYGTYLERRINNIIGRIFGQISGLYYIGTRQLIRRLKKEHIDVIHLHNLHSYCIDLSLLFRYIKKNNIPVIWTLHDCWSFTGHCPHFIMAKCDKWKTGCHNCPQYREYPQSLVDNSKFMWKLKKKWFTGVENMTLVTPSRWLADLVKQSYLKDYPVEVINNGIDLSVFHPTERDFREKHGISSDCKMLLGVAFGWGVRKGLDVFIELSKQLDSEKYQIVLVGTDDTVDKQLPKNIISIHRTQNQQELAEIYSVADLFVNPTREENYPTVNMESIACGTPVLTFRTGGSPEILDETCGSVVDCDDIDAFEKEIIRICEEKPYSKGDCIIRAKSFDMNDRIQEYVKLYKG